MAGPNWDAIETEYVTSAEGITYRQLAEKHGLNQATVSKWAKRREWVAKREAHRRQAASKAQAEIAKATAKEQAEAILDARSELMETARILGERIRSCEMNPGTLDKAANAQVAVFKFLEVLGGNPDSRTEQSVNIRPLDQAEIKRLKELVYALGDGDGTGPGDGGGGSSGDGAE